MQNNDKLECYDKLPTSINTYNISNQKYLVVSKFMGNKDIKKVIQEIAIRQTYAEIKNK